MADHGKHRGSSTEERRKQLARESLQAGSPTGRQETHTERPKPVGPEREYHAPIQLERQESPPPEVVDWITKNMPSAEAAKMLESMGVERAEPVDVYAGTAEEGAPLTPEQEQIKQAATRLFGTIGSGQDAVFEDLPEDVQQGIAGEIGVDPQELVGLGWDIRALDDSSLALLSQFATRRIQEDTIREARTRQQEQQQPAWPADPTAARPPFGGLPPPPSSSPPPVGAAPSPNLATAPPPPLAPPPAPVQPSGPAGGLGRPAMPPMQPPSGPAR